MAKTGERVTGSYREQVLRWLAEHPGDHRPSEIAVGLGWTDSDATHRVAVAARALAVAKPALAVRGLRGAVNGRRPHNTYGISPAGRALAAEPVGAAGQSERTAETVT